jgi:hypothetical protein
MIERLNNLIPAERLDSFLEIGKKREIKATHYFIRAGEVPYRVAFVASGLFRYVYINDKGHEFTKGFIMENNFISSLFGYDTWQTFILFDRSIRKCTTIRNPLDRLHAIAGKRCLLE